MIPASLPALSLLLGLAAYAGLAALLVSRWLRAGADLSALCAAALTASWFAAVLLAGPGALAHSLEVSAMLAWMWLLGRVLGLRWESFADPRRRSQLALTVAGVVLSAGLIVTFVALSTTADGAALLDYVAIMGKLSLCLIGLVMVEQVVRNTRRGHQWNLKFLTLGLGTLFGYGFMLYGEALLFNRVNPALAVPQGLVSALAVPMLIIALGRNPAGTLPINVSQELVFRAGVLVVAGVYLILLAAAAIYVQAVGGAWGEALAVVMGVLGALALTTALLSTRVRGQLRRMIQRYVYRSRFDYRDEWDRVTRELTRREGAENLAEGVIHALGHVTQSTEGAVWRLAPAGSLLPVAQLKVPWHRPLSAATARQLRNWFAESADTVDLHARGDVAHRPADFPLPDELADLGGARFVVPLMVGDALFGIVVLGRARAPIHLGVEAQRLLGLIAREAAGYLALHQADGELNASRSLRNLNEIAAFVVHDLKNVTAELDLLVANAQRHRGNPEFMDDVQESLHSASVRLKQLLGKLRAPDAAAEPDGLELASLVAGIVERYAERPPFPAFTCTRGPIWVAADAEPLSAALDHLLDNAREAAGPGGRTAVSIEHDGAWAAVSVEDNGAGMSAQFIEHELFTPFVTTKGRTGIGIGAYQARESVRRFGGDITVSSQPGAGSRFVVHLPLIKRGQTRQENRHDSATIAHH